MNVTDFKNNAQMDNTKYFSLSEYKEKHSKPVSR